MAELILAKDAANTSQYSLSHITWLLRKGHVLGQKLGRDWWVDPDDLERYEKQMVEIGGKKFDPTKYKKK